MAGDALPLIPIGLMLLVCSLLGLALMKVRMPMMLSCLFTGMLASLFFDQVNFHMNQTLAKHLSDIGVFFVLFSSGMEINPSRFSARWKVASVQTILQCIVGGVGFGAVAFAIMDKPTWENATFFAVACLMSSGFIVRSVLVIRDEKESMTGQLVQALQVAQNYLGVLAMGVMYCYDPARVAYSIGEQIGLMLAKLVVLQVFLYLLRRFFLEKWFQWMSVSADHIFLGTVGYALGTSAACLLAKSGGIGLFGGSYYTGITVGSLPFRLEIEQKVEGIKMLGMTFHFIILGFEADITGVEFGNTIGYSVLVAVLVSFVFPMVCWVLGMASGLTNHTSLSVGFLMNQNSEFTLILSQMAYQYKVFERSTMLIFLLSTIISILFSCTIHVWLDRVIAKLRTLTNCSNKWAYRSNRNKKEPLKKHILLLGYSELAQMIADTLSNTTEVVLVIDDMKVYKALASTQKHLRSKTSALTRQETGHGLAANFTIIYGDYQDVDFRKKKCFIDDAQLVVVCESGNQFLQREIARNLKETDVPFVCVADTYTEPKILYELGATYVLQTDHVAANLFGETLEAEVAKGKEAYKVTGEMDCKTLRRLKISLGSLFFHN